MIREDLRKRILILDGGMGTSIQKYLLTEADFRKDIFENHSCELQGNNDILNLTQPQIIEQLHTAYIDAGADIITANTFSANSISQKEYKCENYVRDINLKAVEIAQRAVKKANRKIYIAASLGPTSKTLSLASDISKPAYRTMDFDTLVDAHYFQIKILAEAGIDLFLIETVFDSLNAKATIYAIEKVEEDLGLKFNVMLSATVNDKSGRTLTGQKIDALYTSISHYPILSFGLNCSFGASDLRPIIADLSRKVSCGVSIYPNAGLPNEMGEYTESPDFTANCIKNMADDKLLNIAGGCCGTTPKHIAAVKKALSNCPPREIPQDDNILYLSGLEVVEVNKERTNFINIGERTNVAGSKKFARLINDKKYAEAIEIARKQIESGASIIDINMDDAMLDSKAEMRDFIRILNNEPEVAKAAIMIDSSQWDTIFEGLKNVGGKSIVNSISLKNGEEEFILQAREIKHLGAAVVVMAFDEEGQAVSYERKIEISKRAYDILTQKIGFKPQDIIFDVNVLSIATGMPEHNNYAVDFIRAVSWIKENLPYAKCSGGISNLSFAFRGNNVVREAMHSVFLYHAIKAGLDMGIVNPSMLQIYDNIEPTLLKAVEDVVLNRDENATDVLIGLAEKILNEKQSNTQILVEDEWRKEGLEERFKYALVKGITTYLAEDIHEALQDLKPVDIIEGPLMRAMERVGELFGEGKMFLPQVVKAAAVMRNAVDLLQPAILSTDASGSSMKKKRVVLATVKGDVHDIGKNIVNIVLSCNNLDVLDLGVMVDNDTIINAVKEFNADILGVSGLITPSLKEMELLCEQMQKENLKVPLIVGGATTSKLHTAIKLAPKYNAGVIAGGDASQTATIIKRIFINRVDYLATVEQEQKQLREIYAQKDNKILDFNIAQERAFVSEKDLVQPKINTEEILSTEYNLREIAQYIKWKEVFRFWGFKNINENNLDTNIEAKKLFEDVKLELDGILADNSFKAMCKLKFFDAKKDKESIVLDNSYRLEMLRQQGDKEVCYCLSDFFDTDKAMPIGLFVLGIRDEIKANDDYKMLLRACIAARITEAFANCIQARIANGEKIMRPAFGYPTCPDHSLKQDVFNLLEIESTLGLKLNNNFSIEPATAICGLFIAHPLAKYFSIGAVNKTQIEDYAKRKALSIDEAVKYLGFLYKD